MATEKQYQFFKNLYDEEVSRENQLNQAARQNISLVTLYSAFILFVVEKLRPETLLSKGVFVLTVVFMLAAFLSSFWAIRVSTFEAPNYPRDVIDAFGEAPPSDEDFFDDRIADYTIAYERNSKVNDAKAANLTFAGYAILLGIGFHACYFLLQVL